MGDSDNRLDPSNGHLKLHNFVLLVIYVLATFLAYKLLSIPAAHTSFVTALSSAAILATFGSALSTVGSLWTGDRTARVALDVDILYRDIFKAEAWRRWPFLLRGGEKKLFGGNLQTVQLQNPKFPLHVGSHDIEIHIPTVQEDFFDLPLFANLVPLVRFRKAAHTTMAMADRAKPFSNKLLPSDQYMAYECLTDIWTSVLIFRIGRYVVHFGAALTIASSVIGIAAAAASAV